VIAYFENNFMSLFVSSSVVATILSSAINYLVFRKKEKNLRLKEFKKICENYGKRSLIMHREFRERVFKNNGTEMCNVINETRLRDFCKEIQEDVSLRLYCEEFKVNKDNLDSLLDENKEISYNQVYVIIDNIRKEFVEIREKLSA